MGGRGQAMATCLTPHRAESLPGVDGVSALLTSVYSLRQVRSVCVCVCVCVRERGGERDSERDKERERTSDE